MSALKYVVRLLALLLLFAAVSVAQAEIIEIELAETGELPVAELLASLSLSRYEAGDTPNPDHLRILVERGQAELKKALQALGYYRAKIHGTLNEEDGVYSARYNFDLGQPVALSESQIEITGDGRDDGGLLELVANFNLAPGTPLRHDDYESAKRRLLTRAIDTGYLDAKLTIHELVINLDSYTARIHIAMETGALYHFGPVTFTQGIISDSILRRYLPFAEGDRYRSRDLTHLRRNLLDSGYFNEAKLETTRTETPPTVEVATSLVAKPNHRFELGVGYGTDTGARTSFGWEWRRVNERAHRIRSDNEVSEIGHDLGLRYSIPLKEGITEQYVLSGNQKVEDTDAAFFRRNRVGVSRDSFRLKWLFSLGADFESEDYIVADESNSSQLLMPFLSLQRTWSDDPILPTNGYSLFGRGHFAEENFASSVSFWQVRGSMKIVLSPARGHRFLLRAEGGYTDIASAENLPASQRFFAGGDNSVRGYAYRSLGPENDAGQVVGGRYLAVGGTEYEYAFSASWAGAVFFDAGNAYDELSVAEAMQGAGVGVRWRLPFGALRFDVAKALSRDGNLWRGHLTLGIDL